jgi:hypothetical protein
MVRLLSVLTHVLAHDPCSKINDQQKLLVHLDLPPNSSVRMKFASAATDFQGWGVGDIAKYHY